VGRDTPEDFGSKSKNVTSSSGSWISQEVVPPGGSCCASAAGAALLRKMNVTRSLQEADPFFRGRRIVGALYFTGRCSGIGIHSSMNNGDGFLICRR
jgi:hypothetical protein